MPDRIRSQGVAHSEVGVAAPRTLYDNSTYFKKRAHHSSPPSIGCLSRNFDLQFTPKAKRRERAKH
jgi:hypothetical protein